jgi:hypothetical protein
MFRFTIRELVLLTVIVAMGLGWWVHVRRLQGEAKLVQSDLLTQARFVDQFVHVLTKLGCEIPLDSDPRCAVGGPYTRVFVPQELQGPTHCISFTLSGPRNELQRTLDGDYARRFGSIAESP